MREQVIIDGNNLLYAMREHAPLPPLGRETLVKLIDRWARQANVQVTIVFDGPTPREGLAQQMATRRVNVRYSAPQTADDIIARLLKGVRDPGGVRVISSDTAVRSDALQRRCRHTDCVRFVSELCPPRASRGSVPDSIAAPSRPQSPSEKPEDTASAETDDWLRWLRADDLETPDEWNELGR